ncbi:MAG: hypothetical protein KGO82_14325 [Bacteroidota bacterium]|nr:hypothetical protein [Bacteroidota bacterium]
MAKAKKKAAPRRPAPAATRATRRALIPVAAGAAPVTVSLKFVSGIGQVTASLFRQGVLINMESISNEGDIVFSQAQKNDTISVNGVCTGQASITINTATNPATPDRFSNEIIVGGYIIS